MSNEAKKKYEKAVEYLKSLGIMVDFKSVPENPAWGKDSWEKFNFFLTFKKDGDVFTSYFSQSCRKPYFFGKVSVYDSEKKAELLKIENKYPDIFGALNCFVSDSDCLDSDFEEWCSNLGYDSDSRKAEKTYNACKEQTKGFLKIFDRETVANYLEENELN